jgi:hypothetical protein
MGLEWMFLSNKLQGITFRMIQGFKFDVNIQGLPTKLTGSNLFHPENPFDGRLSENWITVKGNKIFPVPTYQPKAITTDSGYFTTQDISATQS